jgi:CheY-like chemotaxis protein
MTQKCRTILVAEDDAEDAFFLQRAFIQSGIQVRMDFVKDGQETISYLKGEDGFEDRHRFPFPGLLLLDLKMPKLDGFDVLRWLQTQAGLRRLPVTVLSSSEEPCDVNRAYDLGANSYLVKPAANDNLSDIVEKIRYYWLEVNEQPNCFWRDPQEQPV